MTFVARCCADQSWHEIEQLTVPYSAAFSTCAPDNTNDNVFLFGGIHNESYADSTYHLNFTTSTWDEIESSPAPFSCFFGTYGKDNTYWCFGGTSYYFNLTDETWHTLNTIPSMPTNTTDNCAVYDSDRNIFFIIGGTDSSGATSSTTTVIFNLTSFENENFDNVWQYDIFGQMINQTGFRDNLHSQACVYYNSMVFSFGGITDGTPQNSIFMYVVIFV